MAEYVQPRDERTRLLTATSVLNLKGHGEDPDFADFVYVGRAMYRGGWKLPGSPLASPFRPGRDGSREEVLARYRQYLLGRPDLLALLPGLLGRRLGCWCVPEPCHAQVLARGLAERGECLRERGEHRRGQRRLQVNNGQVEAFRR